MSTTPPRKVRRIRCRSCKQISRVLGEQSPRFCPLCGFSLLEQSTVSAIDPSRDFSITEGSSVSFIQGHEPNEEPVQFSIGPYQVFRSIGKGGMGEVLLAYDTICGRRIALKRIRPDLLGYKQIQNRFLKEARVTSQLTHPAIIPIYSIHHEEQAAYYTMPFVEGETLKQILRQAKQQEKKELKPEQAEGSIPSLLRIFLAVCQAIAYAHSKGVLHRDLKPENIIVGTYGEVQILDWGLAKLLSSDESNDMEEEPKLNPPLHHITQIGKVVGTVNYMAPERACNQPATQETDIYSLGVILYQILTLRFPFLRKTLKDFKENFAKEKLIDPIEAAPYRDIPKILANICLKCLAPSPEKRYSSVTQLIHELENYIEGRAEWFQISELSYLQKSDWEFQEHILIAEHTAITRTVEISEWVNLMISKASFAENIKIETSLYFDQECQGAGILFNIPELTERDQINDGYCLWIASDLTKSTKLLRSSIEVLHLPDIFLSRGEWHTITIEKVDSCIRLLFDGVEQFRYLSRMPLVGTHVGILTRDTMYQMKPLKIFVGSQNILVNCLAIPDAFLAHKSYSQALSEYRRIGYAFSGRAEGREAILRAGITLIEQAKNSLDPTLFDAALEEFEHLHQTAGAPLEYLGKALVYEAQQDIDEEIKCFEMAYRRYPKHPLLFNLQEQMLFRLMENSRIDRYATYHFLLLTLRHISRASLLPHVKKLMLDLQEHWEPLIFLIPMNADEPQVMITPLAFWLHKNYVLEEFARTLKNRDNVFINTLLSLYALDEKEQVLQLSKELLQKDKQPFSILLEPDIEKSLAFFQTSSIEDPLLMKVFFLLCERALEEKRTDLIYKALKNPDSSQLTQWIEALLIDQRWNEAEALFKKLPQEQFMHESSLLHYLYGCLLYVKEGKESAHIHWSSVLDMPYPRSWTLASHYLIGKLDSNWHKKAFYWEKKQLKRQLSLFETITQSRV